MFTGIIQKKASVVAVESFPRLLKYAVELDDIQDLELGASVSIDGVCQTVVQKQGAHVWFDAIEETLMKTTLNDLNVGRVVNVERAAKFGDEIGGHQVSGHVYGTAEILAIEENRYAIQCPHAWMKYFFQKGFIAIDGVSLTVVNVEERGVLSVHLIPETLSRTVLGDKKAGDRVNIEIDAHTQIIVETMERFGALKS